MIEGYIPQNKRKKILLLSDDLRMHSGIATMSREIVLKSSHRYNWVQLGAALRHPDIGKIFDLKDDINKRLNIDDASVKIIPNNGYGDAGKIRQLLKTEKPDAIFIFTDPRYWVWLFQIEREIRSQIPIFYLNIWDDYPAPLYNKSYYDSCDLLMGISKQTVNINKLVLAERAKDKVIKYTPHGIDENLFFPVGKDHEFYPKLEEFKKNTIPIETDFVVYFNARNIHRKRPGDIILSFKMFCDKLPKEQADKCALVMHTQVSDPNGTDLKAVKEAIYPEGNIFFSQGKLTPEQMNFMYNMSDVTMLISSNEGWGLSLTESMICGTMIITNVTGGMQDQCRFENDKGEWIDFDANFPSNHRGTYKKHGEWVEPVFPSNVSLAGSPQTPYIFDDRCAPEDVADSLLKVYSYDKKERDRRGMLGHEWCHSDEAKLSSTAMVKSIGDAMEEAFKKFVPRERYEVIKVETKPPKKVLHKIYGY